MDSSRQPDIISKWQRKLQLTFVDTANISGLNGSDEIALNVGTVEVDKGFNYEN